MDCHIIIVIITLTSSSRSWIGTGTGARTRGGGTFACQREEDRQSSGRRQIDYDDYEDDGHEDGDNEEEKQEEEDKRMRRRITGRGTTRIMTMTVTKRKKMRRWIRSQRQGHNHLFIILICRTREHLKPQRNLPTKVTSAASRVLQLPRRVPPGRRHRDLFVASMPRSNTIG
jgi:hypothetical protein